MMTALLLSNLTQRENNKQSNFKFLTLSTVECIQI